MSNTFNSILLTSNTHPLVLGLTLFTIALLLSFTLIVIAFTALHSDPYDCEENITLPSSSEEAIFFSKGETRPLLLLDHDNEAWLDPLKDFPHGRRYVVKSDKQAKKQRFEKARLREVLVADWAGKGYGSIKGPVGGKRRREDEGFGRGKRVRVEENGSGEEGDW